MYEDWSFPQKIIFLFLFSYVLLYCFSTNFITSDLLSPIWTVLVPKFASFVGESNMVIAASTGSGDTRFDWYSCLFYGVLALLISSVVAIMDRKRANYSTLFLLGMVILRYYLAYQMLIYGLAKVYCVQFPMISVSRLETTVGDLFPMGLLWAFMEYSRSYTVFTGLLELLGGVFLLSRRTMTLGGLITFGVMANVLMLNLSYDVPVKLMSAHIVFFSLIIVLIDRRRLFNFFTNRQDTNPSVLPDLVPGDWKKFKTPLKWLLIVGYFAYSMVDFSKMQEDRKQLESTIERYQQYPLTRRKFNWIQEQPNNR